jgi:hypothetical protein
MLKLTNICDDPWTLAKFGNSTGKIEGFLTQCGLDGFELIKWRTDGEDVLPRLKLIGRHLNFWPTWLDFWQGDKAELARQFGPDTAWKSYFNASTIGEFVQNYRRELLDAEAMGARYAVFHVSHVQLEHCYNYQYTYTDREVVDASVELLNQILDGLDIHFTVLMENHWYPGLTFLDNTLAERLLDGVAYPNKGFVLDIGHLMNTNIELTSEGQAVEYILSVLRNLRCVEHIRAIHLNSSLTGGYVKETQATQAYDPMGSYEDRLRQAITHVGKIDRHAPFLDPSIRRVIEVVQPEFLVYELASSSLEDLQKAVESQNKALGTPV